jgi:hypothetical protein
LFEGAENKKIAQWAILAKEPDYWAGSPSYIAWASRKTRAPKLSAALIFLWLLSFYQEKESNMI